MKDLKHIKRFNESSERLETIEEELERLFKKYSSHNIGTEDNYEFLMDKKGFKEAISELIKWQSGGMYSEDDMREAWENGRNGTGVVGSPPFVATKFKYNSFAKWFEEFKNRK